MSATRRDLLGAGGLAALAGALWPTASASAETLLQFRAATSTDWLANDPVLMLGEPAVEIDTGKLKIGDGASPWHLLPYFLTEPQERAAFATVPIDGTPSPAERRRMYNVRDYLDAGDTVSADTDVSAAINRAIGAAAADSSGRAGQVVMPPMNKRLAVGSITPINGVDIIGSGWGSTVLRPQSTLSAVALVKGTGTTTPLTGVRLADFEIDGSQQAGTFSSSIKGVYITYLLRCVFEHLYIHDTGASGLGIDYLYDCVIDDVVAERCGRLGTSSSSGCAGIGIGTNSWGGKLDVRNCLTRDNKRDGLFFETQSGGLASNVRVVGHTSEGNGGHGMADAGCRALQVVGGHSKSNGRSGFAVYMGTVGASTPGVAGQVVGLDCSSNTENGVHVDPSIAGTSDYNFKAIKLRSNHKHGVLVAAGSSPLAGIHVSDADIEGNWLNGFTVVSKGGGAISDISLSASRIRNNGTSTGSTGHRNAIKVMSSVTRLTLRGVQTWDDQTPKTQQYGLMIDSGAVLTSGFIDGLDCRDNANGPVSIAGTFDGTVVGTNPGWTVAAGSPEGVVAAPLGTQYRRTDGGPGTTLYVKESGAATSTGWAAK